MRWAVRLLGSRAVSPATRLPPLLLLLGLGACFAPALEVTGKGCSELEACPGGFACVFVDGAGACHPEATLELLPSGSQTADFDTSALPEPWRAQLPVAGNTLEVAGAAAHRGAGGLRFTDRNAGAGAGEEGAAVRSTGQLAGERFYLRTWLRVSESNGQGSPTVLALHALGLEPSSILELFPLFPSAELALGGWTATGASPLLMTQVRLVPGAWMLVEVLATGLGSAAAERTLHVDGTRAGHQTGLDWRGARVDELRLGEPWSGNRAFTGALDFDDVRWAAEPLASTLQLSGVPSVLPVGACVAARGSLVDSMEGRARAAPYPVVATLSAEGAGLYLDARCERPAAALTIPRGAEAVLFYLRSSAPAPLRVTLSHVDFLPGAREGEALRALSAD